MRCLLRFIVCLAVLTGPAFAHTNPPLHNPHAYPRSARILFINTPLDPQRKIYMYEAEEGSARSWLSSARARHVLSYLRQMVRVSRNFNRRDMVHYYEEAYQLVSARVYGTLPKRIYRPNDLAYNPNNPPLPDPPPGPRPEMRQQPRRKIVKVFTKPYRTWELTYEELECGHIRLAPVGYSVPAKSRRCSDCAREALAKLKKPSVSAAAAPKKKAVGA